MRTQAKRNLPGKDRQEQAALIVAALRLDVVGLRAKGLVGALGSRNWPVVGFTFNELTKEPEDANVDAERLRLCSLIDTQQMLITEGRASLKALKRKLCALDRSQSSTSTLSLSEANDTILASEPPGRWTNGAIQFSTTSTDASKVLSYLDDRNNYDFMGHLVVGSHKLGGFSNESRSQADRHNAARQWQHSTIFPHSVLKEACTKIPGFKALLGASALLPVQTHAGRKLVALHAIALDQTSRLTRFREHDDLDEEFEDVSRQVPPLQPPRPPVRDRKVVFTAIISLAGGVTSVQIPGKQGGEVHFGRKSGSGVIFQSALTHATATSGKGIRKLTIFFGYFLCVTQ